MIADAIAAFCCPNVVVVAAVAADVRHRHRRGEGASTLSIHQVAEESPDVRDALVVDVPMIALLLVYQILLLLLIQLLVGVGVLLFLLFELVIVVVGTLQ